MKTVDDVIARARRRWPGGAYSLERRSLFGPHWSAVESRAELTVIADGPVFEIISAPTLDELFEKIPEASDG